MTPDRLQEIRDRLDMAERMNRDYAGFDWAREMSAYIDLLHEDLRITRAERDAEKKKNMQAAKDHAADIRAWQEVVTVARADAWDEGYDVGCNDGWHDDYKGTTNPYRKDTK